MLDIAWAAGWENSPLAALKQQQKKLVDFWGNQPDLIYENIYVDLLGAFLCGITDCNTQSLTVFSQLLSVRGKTPILGQHINLPMSTGVGRIHVADNPARIRRDVTRHLLQWHIFAIPGRRT